MFKKIRSHYATTSSSGDGMPSDMIKLNNSSRQCRQGSFDSEASVTDVNVTESDDDSVTPQREHPSKDMISVGHAPILRSSTNKSNLKLMAYDAHQVVDDDEATDSERRSRHSHQQPKRVTIAEMNRYAIFDATGSVSEFHASTRTRSVVACQDSDVKSLTTQRSRPVRQCPPRNRRVQSNRRTKPHPGGNALLPQDNQNKRPSLMGIINPFEHRREVYLCGDMAHVADAMKLDLNTQSMLALYDAKSLEDFSLMAPSDIDDLIIKARDMGRSIPPLQIRKIEVLREWTQEISRLKDESRIQPWNRRSPLPHRGTSRRLIPRDWKDQFHRDLPRLKQRLQARSSALSIFSVNTFIPNCRRISMCGLVE